MPELNGHMNEKKKLGYQSAEVDIWPVAPQERATRNPTMDSAGMSHGLPIIPQRGSTAPLSPIQIISPKTTFLTPMGVVSIALKTFS